MCDQQCLRPACAYAQSDQSLRWLLEYFITIKLLNLGYLSLKGGCTGSSESTLVKMAHCWKSHVRAHFIYRKSKLLVKHTTLLEISCRGSLIYVVITTGIYKLFVRKAKKEDPDQTLIWICPVNS